MGEFSVRSSLDSLANSEFEIFRMMSHANGNCAKERYTHETKWILIVPGDGNLKMKMNVHGCCSSTSFICAHNRRYRNQLDSCIEIIKIYNENIRCDRVALSMRRMNGFLSSSSTRPSHRKFMDVLFFSNDLYNLDCNLQPPTWIRVFVGGDDGHSDNEKREKRQISFALDCTVLHHLFRTNYIRIYCEWNARLNTITTTTTSDITHSHIDANCDELHATLCCFPMVRDGTI